MELKLALEQAGLAGNEIKVYLALLNLGSAGAGEITKKSGVNRTNVYDALERLIEKGLVSYVIKANRKYFESTPPDNIITHLTKQEQEIQNKKQLLTSLLPEIEKRRKLSHQPQEATIYQGKKGFKSLAEDVLKTKQELLAFGAEGKFYQTFPHYAKHWHTRREKLKVPVKIIYNEKIRKTKEKLKRAFMKQKYTSTLEDTPATTWIYGDKVAIVVWAEQITITLIRSQQLAQTYRQFFNLLWQNSKS